MNSRIKKFNRKNEKRIRHLNKLIRQNCCWNCLQGGHLRFQCPYPKMTRCSFCRKPFVLSINCNCKDSSQIQGVSAHLTNRNAEIQAVDDTEPFHVERVLVSLTQNESDVDPNILVFVENDVEIPKEDEEDKDILVINTDHEFLDEI